ncbi:ketopantoate reductase family protein [Haloferacaceae archaeon DSL9]
MHILVYGAGSLGSLVGGLLARVHDVTLVGRKAHASAIERDGLELSGAVAERTFPAARTDADGLRADLAIVTVKSFDTETAAAALSTGDYGAVLSLQNGLVEERLARALADPAVLAGTATYGARFLEPGRVRCTGVGRIVLGALGGGTDPWAERVGKAFRDAGMGVLVASDMPRRRWEKLAVNAAINPTTALARVENGALADGPATTIAKRAARECARVARAEGVRLSNRQALAALERVAATTAANHSSMRQDVAAERRTEIDALNGEVVARASAHRLAVPTNELLTALVRAWEREHTRQRR